MPRWLVVRRQPPQQRLLLRALAREPASQLLAGAFLRAHGLGSVGGVQHAARQLELHDLIQRDLDDGVWRVVDPILALWLRGQEQQHLDAVPEGEP